LGVILGNFARMDENAPDVANEQKGRNVVEDYGLPDTPCSHFLVYWTSSTPTANLQEPRTVEHGINSPKPRNRHYDKDHWQKLLGLHEASFLGGLGTGWAEQTPIAIVAPVT